MAHPNRKEAKDFMNRKLEKMTADYGNEPPTGNVTTKDIKYYNHAEGPQPYTGFGAEYGLTENKGGKYRVDRPVKRAAGGSVKKGKGSTTVNIVIAGQQRPQAPDMPAVPVPPPGGLAGAMPPRPPVQVPPPGIPPVPPAAMNPGITPPRARGGRIHKDLAEDKALIRKMVDEKCRRMAGGAIERSRYHEGLKAPIPDDGDGPHIDFPSAGAKSGHGRLEKMGIKTKIPKVKPQVV